MIEENIKGHKISWIVERIGWVFMFGIVIAGILGFFGNGPVSYRTAVIEADTIKYEHFLRYQSETFLEIKAKPVNDYVLVQLPNHYFNAFQMMGVNPLPEKTVTINDHVVYYFAAKSAMVINFGMQPETYASLKSNIWVNDHQFNLSQFIYP